MDPNQFNPQFNPQGQPNNQQGPWQQQNMQPGPPGPQNPQPPNSAFPNSQQPMSGFPNPQHQQQQPSGLQSPRPQHPQGPPAFATAGTPQLNGMYSPPTQPGGQAQQPMVQLQGQQGPPPFPLADNMRMAPGPHRIVQTPGLVPPGTIPQPQQAHNGTPLSFGGAAGHPGPPSHQQSPHPSQIPLPESVPSSVHGSLQPPPSVHGSVQPPRPGPFGLPMGGNHPSGLAQNPTQQNMPPMAQQSMQGGPSIAPHISQQQVHGGAPMAPPFAQAGPPAGAPAPRMHNSQATGANAQQPHVMFEDESNREMEALQEEMFNMRMRDAKAATAKDLGVQVSWEDVKGDFHRAKYQSYLAREEALLKQWAEERGQARGDGAPSGAQGGGSQRGAGGAAPWAKRCFLSNFTKSKKEPASNDPPAAPRIAATTPERRRRREPSISNIADEDDGGVVLGEQPATRNVDLERSKSPARSPSRTQRHHRRRVAASSSRRRSAGEVGSSRARRDNAERWRSAGMYYESGENQGGDPGDVRIRSKRWDFQS